MIDKELFISIIKEVHNADHFINELYRLGIESVDNPLFYAYGYILDRYWEAYFTDEAIDTINWFMYEHHSIGDDFDAELKMLEPGQLSVHEENGNLIPMDTIDDLWEYVKDFRK